MVCHSWLYRASNDIVLAARGKGGAFYFNIWLEGLEHCDRFFIYIPACDTNTQAAEMDHIDTAIDVFFTLHNRVFTLVTSTRQEDVKENR